MPTNLRVYGPGYWYDHTPIEVAIIKWLGTRGEVIASGSGREWWEIKLTLNSDAATNELVASVLAMLVGVGAPKESKVAVVD